MDSLLVDLDKVLDDLEAEENNDTPVLPPGHEIKPSGYEDYLEQNSEKPWKLISEAPYHQGDTHYDLDKPPDKNMVNIMYDIPYEPTDKFDMSEADFAPSPTAGKRDYSGTSIYDFSKGTESDSYVNSDSKTTGVNKHLQNEYDLSRPKSDVLTSDFVKNDLHSGTVRVPIQAADLSPDKVHSFQMNGHATDSDLYLPKLDNVSSIKEEPVKPLTLSCFSSTNSDRTGSDTDKTPVQCNTPSTPYENVHINPFDSQIKVKSSEIPEPSQSLEVYDSGSAKSSHRDSQSNINLDIKNQILSQTQSLSNNNLYFSPYSSLPVGSGEPNPASQFHSLPPTLGLHMQGINQNGEVEVVEDAPGYVQGKLSAETSNTDVVDQRIDQSNDDTHQADINEPEVQSVQICSFTDDVELNEKDLDDYLGDENIDVMNEPDLQTKDIPGELVTASSCENLDVNPTLSGINSGDIKTNEDLKTAVTDLKPYTEPDFSVELDNAPCRTPMINFGVGELDILENKEMQSESLGEPENKLLAKTKTLTESQPVASENGIEAKHKTESELQEFKLSSEEKSEVQIPTLVSDSIGSAQETVIQALETGDVAFDNGAIISEDTSGTIVDSLDIEMKTEGTQKETHRPSMLASLTDVNLNSPFRENDQGDSSLDVTDEHAVPSTHRKLERVCGGLANMARENESRQLMDPNGLQKSLETENIDTCSGNENTEEARANHTDDTMLEEETVELRQTQLQMGQNGSSVRPQSWGPSETGQSQVLKQKRPTSLNLSPRPEFNPQNDTSPDQSPEETGASGENLPDDHAGEELSGAVAGAEGPSLPAHHPQYDPGPPPPYSTTLGRVAPKWVPDAEAPACMNCDARFTFTKRRHHCRACGKVFCSQCCSMKNRLVHMENREGRVCFQCHQILQQAELWNEASGAGRNPHPNNPNDYCSTVPPTQQAASSLSPPSVLVPVAGVLKRDGGNRRSAEPKQVMFSDGIRPGGDLTELDGSAEVSRMPPRRSRVQKKVERHSQDGHHSPRSRRIRAVEDRTSRCLIPGDGLPPLVLSLEPGAGYSLMPNPEPDDFMQQIKDDEASPVIFAITPNLHVLVKIINLDCCVNHVVWCFTTQGMCTVGQEEIVTALEVSPDETTVPKDIFTHLYNVYEEASKGNVVTELGHTIFNQSFLGSRDHGGFLYVRSTFQCVQKFVLPQPPYLFAILLQKWETPWAKVFPIRLMLRLGAEYRYYPCPLIGVRNRKPVYFEIGHTIMNLLADFRNYQYMLPQISGITIHMEDKVTTINFPKNRYDELMKVVNNSNEHVMAMGATFSMEADSHLVCIQNDDGNYQTQAINIQNKPRKVTGASFVVFNGALKTSSGLSAKSSIVEDGLMVQITPDSMLALKQALKDMQDYTISCGTISAPKPDELVKVQWVDDDRSVNIGVKSPVDNMAMDGIDSLHIYSSPDYSGENQIIRWTEVFFIQNDESGSVKWDPVDLSRLGETLATACCLALVPHLGKLKEAALTKIGLRVTIKPDMVGYEAGAGGERLPDIYMNDLDNELIPVMHRATQQSHVGTVLELIFQILN